MADLKATDLEDRDKLMVMMEELENILAHPDEALNQQLQMEDITKNYMERLQHYRSMLKQEECPVLVVGQSDSVFYQYYCSTCISSNSKTVIPLYLKYFDLGKNALSSVPGLSYYRHNFSQILHKNTIYQSMHVL